MAKAQDSLSKYRAKRDFKKTREPQGIVKKSSGHSYLIQKHEASHLHYDFRLELEGKFEGRAFDEIEPQLKNEWNESRQSLSWDKAKPASRDAYNRIQQSANDNN